MKVMFRNKIVGDTENNIYITYRRPEHIMYMFKGFGISDSLLSFLIDQFDVKKIRILYRSPALNRTYEWDIMTFVLSKKIWIDKTTNGKEDVQKFVSLEEQDWEEIKEGLPIFQKKRARELMEDEIRKVK